MAHEEQGLFDHYDTPGNWNHTQVYPGALRRTGNTQYTCCLLGSGHQGSLFFVWSEPDHRAYYRNHRNSRSLILLSSFPSWSGPLYALGSSHGSPNLKECRSLCFYCNAASGLVFSAFALSFGESVIAVSFPDMMVFMFTILITALITAGINALIAGFLYPRVQAFRNSGQDRQVLCSSP
jgi:hypothetical protein